MSASYPMTQQIYSISSLTNAAFGVSFDSTNDMETYLKNVVNAVLGNSTIQGYIGSDWEVVWGPWALSENPNATSVVADNTMLLVYSPSNNQFILGIAGTNADSTFDWLKEDFSVNSRVMWTDVMGSQFTIPDNTYVYAAISGGTATGLNNLLNMTDGSGDTLITALSNKLSSLSSSASLAVVGHSLGGALSPVMGLYLHDSQQFKTNWNSSGMISAIDIYATAGPTPGESVFALYVPYVVANPVSGQAGLSYSSVYNTLDVVPHAWQSQVLSGNAAAPTISDLPALYEPPSGQPTMGIAQPSGSVPSETIVGALAVGAVLNSIDTASGSKWDELSSLMTHIQPITPMTGTFDTTTDSDVTSKLSGAQWVLPTSLQEPTTGYNIYFTNFARYLAQAAFQHTIAYNTLLQIADFVSEYDTIRGQYTPSGESVAQLHEKAVSRVIGVDLTKLGNLTAVKKQSEAAAMA